MNQQLAQYLKGYESKYPHQLEAQFSRIVDRIVALWDSPELEAYFSDLMFGGGRTNRRGFPAEVATEIFILSLAYDEIRKRPATGDANDVWEQEGHQVTLAVLDAPHPTKNAAHTNAEPPTSVKPAAPEHAKHATPPEFNQTLIAVNPFPSNAEAPAKKTEPQIGQVQMSLANHHYTWDTSSVPFTMGRDRSSNIFLTGAYTSRLHARIEIKNGSVFLIDQSSNGTYVTLAGEKERRLKHEEMRLPRASSGVISFGISRDLASEEILHFTIR